MQAEALGDGEGAEGRELEVGEKKEGRGRKGRVGEGEGI